MAAGFISEEDRKLFEELKAAREKAEEAQEEKED